MEMLELVRQMVAEAGAGGTVTVLSVSTVIAKYWLDLWRSAAMQAVLGFVEKFFGIRAGALAWSQWSDKAKLAVSLIQAFLVALLAAIAAGVGWGPALAGAVMAALSTKGVHDVGVLPGTRPTQPISLSRPVSLRTPAPDTVKDRDANIS